MATDKQPRNSAARKTTKSVTTVPTTSQSVSTAQPVGGTARNAVIEGNAALDLDEVRKRAYELYEEEGRLDGKHHDHWVRAESEVRNRKGDQETGKKQSSRGDNKDRQRIA